MLDDEDDNTGDYIEDDEDDVSEEEEDADEALERERVRIAESEAKEHDVAKVFERLGLKNFPECIVSREEWGAEPPRNEGLLLDQPVANVVFTYSTGSNNCQEDYECVKAIQDLQKEQMTAGGMSDIGFNFIVGGDFRVYEGRGWNKQPDPDFQFPELKGKRLDIGFLGDYRCAREKLPWSMAGMALELAHYGVQQGYIAKEYRLVESENHLAPDKYEADKEEIRPDLQLRFENYWPGVIVKEEMPWENPEDQVPIEEYEEEEGEAGDQP